MYNAYERKNDAPEIKAFRYMSILIICLLLPLFLILDSTLKRLGVVNKVNGNWGQILYLVLLGLAFIFCHLAFNRQALVHHEKEFDNCTSLNSSIKIWMLVLFPLIGLAFGIAVHLFLFGGIFLQRKVEGLL